MKFLGGRSPPELRRATLRIGKRLGFLNVSVPDRSRTSAGAVPHRCRTGPEPVPDRSRTGAGPVLGRFRTSRPDLGPAPTRLGPRPRPGPGPAPARPWPGPGPAPAPRATLLCIVPTLTDDPRREPVRHRQTTIAKCIAPPLQIAKYTWPGSNWRPSACEADVIATRPQVRVQTNTQTHAPIPTGRCP